MGIFNRHKDKLSGWFAEENLYLIGSNPNGSECYYIIEDKFGNPCYIVTIGEHHCYKVHNLDGEYMGILFHNTDYKGIIFNNPSNRTIKWVVEDFPNSMPIRYSIRFEAFKEVMELYENIV